MERGDIEVECFGHVIRLKIPRIGAIRSISFVNTSEDVAVMLPVPRGNACPERNDSGICKFGNSGARKNSNAITPILRYKLKKWSVSTSFSKIFQNKILAKKNYIFQKNLSGISI
jgi:hypothetical protein